MRWTTLILVLIGGCTGPRSDAPEAVAQGSSLEPHIGRRVQVRGFLLDRRYKGYLHLYQDRTKEEFFLVSFPERLDWRANLDREVVIVGRVKKIPGFTEEQKKDPEAVPQGYPDGAIIIVAETLQ